MLSNLESQLKEQGAADKIDAVLDEIAVVQKDFGYPPLVTPTSQIVGTQAVLNVMFGRYAQLSNESRHLLVGSYGETPAAPAENLIRRALGELKMEAALETRPADLIPNELDKLEMELQGKLGAATASREDLLSYAMFPQVALQFFKTRAQGPVQIDAPVEKKDAPGAVRSNRFVVAVNGKEHRVTRDRDGSGSLVLTVDGTAYTLAVKPFNERTASGPPVSGSGAGEPAQVAAPMPGSIIRLTLKNGDSVAANETIVVLEALKMQMDIRSTRAGRIKYHVAAGDTVRAGAILADVS
jgi:oxaloacetate decarboxylase (Na+ extruding) subunit alpha